MSEVAVKSEEKVVKKFRKPAKKKVCAFCVAGEKTIDYKDVAKIRKYITEKGKILPRRQTGVCSYHQRELYRKRQNFAKTPNRCLLLSPKRTCKCN